MKFVNGLIVERGDVSVIQGVPRRGIYTIAAEILPEFRQRIELIQSQQEAKGERPGSDSWFVDMAMRRYMIDENRDTAYEDLTGDDQIMGYVSKETKKWVKKFKKDIGRSERWITAKALAVFLRSYDVESESDRGA